ncbi:hypothetical protein S83_051550 [Arachis hypogaea]
MVKFSKQFEGQLIPEWKEAFVDYRQLKKDFKNIQFLNNNNSNDTKNQNSSVPNSIISSLRNYSPFGHHQNGEHVPPIQVHRKLGSSYDTELLEQFAETGAIKEFFACLDQQLNKVNKFYRTKENEFMERGNSLRKQMDILIQLKFAFQDQQGSIDKEYHSISCTFSNGNIIALFFIQKLENSTSLTWKFTKKYHDCYNIF